MIKVVLIAILLVLSPLAKAEILFQDEDVWDAFVGQDFDANLVKAEEGDARAQYLIGRAYLFGLEEQGVNVDKRVLRRFMWIWPDRTGGPPGCQSGRSWR